MEKDLFGNDCQVLSKKLPVRKGFFISNNRAIDEKKLFEKELNRIQSFSGPVVYHNYKLTHSGITNFKSYENCNRKVHRNSLTNLLNSSIFNSNSQVCNQYFDESLGMAPITIKDYRNFSNSQAKECRKVADKLTYYTKKRKFTSKKSGSHSFKIAFLTLTFPDSCSPVQSLKAFELFLDYLRRTANCVYIWKKELGKKTGRLHYHIIINNFIPYYIVDWKWKRLLISQGVEWPVNEKGEDTKSHYRIELPRKAKQISSYISKYMSKEGLLPVEYGYIWGCSKILKDLKEVVLCQGEVSSDELWNVASKAKILVRDHVSIALVDLMKIEKLAPNIYRYFEKQFYEFQSLISLEQRFVSV